MIRSPRVVAISILCVFTAVFVFGGCSPKTSDTDASSPTVVGPPQAVQIENNLFLNQKTFDPWILSTNDPNRKLDLYDSSSGALVKADGERSATVVPGHYDRSGTLILNQEPPPHVIVPPSDFKEFTQELNLKTGEVKLNSDRSSNSIIGGNWPEFWQKSDIVIEGDPEAQQVTHANMFYLAGSAIAGRDNSIPPMGYSSNVYSGHIFWDAEIWMFPALIVQHPSLAKGIIDYRFKHLPQAMQLAKKHGFAGAEYPWESAATGLEEAPDEFSHERHITADIAFAAWQYYLWTGDKAYLRSKVWPILRANAQYWVSRTKKQSDGKYHILGIVGPDETSGNVDDDAWTNGVVAQSLKAAVSASKELGAEADPRWLSVAANIYFNLDKTKGVYIENSIATDRLAAKQADAQMLIYPLKISMSDKTANDTLDYYLKHTITTGPAMTSSINSVIAAQLGRGQQSLDLFHDSYRPFMRGPWDAFSEKRTKDNVYFCTGMGGCLQTVLYGFAGLNIAENGQSGAGKLVAKSGNAALYINPHLPPGWSGLVVKGVTFHGEVFDISIGSGNSPILIKSVQPKRG